MYRMLRSFPSDFRYIKPPRRPEPPAVPPQLLKSDQTKAQGAEDQDLLWKVSRIAKEREQRIPGWSAFNAYISISDIPVATVLYMPFIRASPSDLSTIYTSLLQSLLKNLDRATFLLLLILPSTAKRNRLYGVNLRL